MVIIRPSGMVEKAEDALVCRTVFGSDQFRSGGKDGCHAGPGIFVRPRRSVGNHVRIAVDHQ